MSRKLSDESSFRSSHSSHLKSKEVGRIMPKRLSKVFGNSVHKMSEKTTEELSFESRHSSDTSNIMLTGLSTEFGNSVYEMSGNFPDESLFISSHSSQLKSKEVKNSAAKKMKSSKDKIQSKIDKNRSENGSNLFEILSKTLSNLKFERSVMTEQEDDIKAADIDSGINIANEKCDFSSPKSRNVK